METPNGRIYIYNSYPDIPAPIREEIVRLGLGSRKCPRF